ncbi:hypothetical protein [Sandaracinus amylolyticus]|uniref:hypothetical protein n=1 Tax=Sandaracinus amylolyticus TaxID=927083 RepID=UPI001F4578FE|nr:hypothetical protein [Sandaracinus amylolyticus]UJR79141.1 Hypothetical protein I5071_11740 [Sandaracinus amylolyticus]
MRYRFSSSLLLLVAVAIVVAAPGAARAEPLVCTVTGETGATPLVDCDLIACTDAVTCSGERFEAAVCDQLLLGIEGRVCRPLCGTLFGCDVNEDCPRLLTREGVCVGAVNPPEGFTSGVCAYPTLGLDYCAGSTELTSEQVVDCHRTPDGQPTSSWLAGDCDEDGCPNARDPEPCIDDPIDRCGTVRLGEGECVPDVPGRPDGGTNTDDAGVPDAGGEDHDAGGDEEDAGQEPFDAGVEPPFDGGPTAPPGTNFAGGGGWRCAVPSGARTGAETALLFAAALGALGVRRRR